jgi:hypothetical protein
LSAGPGRYRSRFCISRPTTEHFIAPRCDTARDRGLLDQLFLRLATSLL